MKAKYKKRLKRDIFTIITTLIGMLFISGCGSTWYGEGTVIGKTEMHDAGIMTAGENELPKITNECFYLKVVDKFDVEHEGCVSERVWNDAMFGHQITITKEYK